MVSYFHKRECIFLIVNCLVNNNEILSKRSVMIHFESLLYSNVFEMIEGINEL
jgi:hypothetical protein